MFYIYDNEAICNQADAIFTQVFGTNANTLKYSNPGKHYLQQKWAIYSPDSEASYYDYSAAIALSVDSVETLPPDWYI